MHRHFFQLRFFLGSLAGGGSKCPGSWKNTLKAILYQAPFLEQLPSILLEQRSTSRVQFKLKGHTQVPSWQEPCSLLLTYWPSTAECIQALFHTGNSPLGPIGGMCPMILVGQQPEVRLISLCQRRSWPAAMWRETSCCFMATCRLLDQHQVPVRWTIKGYRVIKAGFGGEMITLPPQSWQQWQSLPFPAGWALRSESLGYL